MHMHADLPTVAHSLCCTLDPGSKPHACLFAQRRRNRAENSGCVIRPDAAAPLIIIITRTIHNCNSLSLLDEFPSSAAAAALFSSLLCYFPSSFVVVNPTIKSSFRSRPFRSEARQAGGQACLHNSSERKRAIAVRGHLAAAVAGRTAREGFPNLPLHTRQGASFLRSRTQLLEEHIVMCDDDVIRDIALKES